MVEAQETQAAAPRASSGRARWYIVHAYSNFEGKVAEAIRDQAGRQGLEAQFEDIQVPTEEVTEVVRGSKKVRQHRHFPGYVLVKMEMTDEAYHLVKNTPKVTGFLGTQNKPHAVTDKEVESERHWEGPFEIAVGVFGMESGRFVERFDANADRMTKVWP